MVDDCWFNPNRDSAGNLQGDPSRFTLRDLWTGATSTTTGAISATVPGHGTAVYRVSGGGTSQSPATFRLRGEASGRCLDVNEGACANGTPR